jgi:outer membrane protein
LGIGTCHRDAALSIQVIHSQVFVRDSVVGRPHAHSARVKDGDTPMLRVTVVEEQETWRLKLEGRLAGDAVAEAAKTWAAAPEEKRVEVDLRGLTCADLAGHELLRRMHAAGASLVAQGVAMKALVEDVRSHCTRAGVVARILSLTLVAFLSHGTTASAQNTTTSPLRLTLSQAVTVGLKQSPEVAIANLSLAESQEARSAARGALLPQVGLRGGEKVTRASLEALFGRRIEGFPDHSGPFWSVEAGAGVSAPVLDLTLWHRWQAARETVRTSTAQQAAVRELNVQLIVSQYLGSLRASADVTAAASRLELAKALLDLASDMQRTGVGTSIDTLRANVEYQNERQRHTEADAQLAIALQGLRRLLSLDPNQPIELADASSFYETPSFDSTDNLERAYRARPELQAVLSQQRAAAALKQAARSERLPRLSVDGGWSLQGLRPSTAIPAYQFGAYVDVPIFTGGRISAESATRDLQLQKLHQVERAVRDQIGFDVKASETRLSSARTEVEAANLGVGLAREGVTQAQDRFRAGVATNIEVITAQDALARANDNQIAALYRYNQARADLARSTGQMESLYAK